MTDDEIVADGKDLLDKIGLSDNDKVIVSTLASKMGYAFMPAAFQMSRLSSLRPHQIMLYSLALMLQTLKQVDDDEPK